MQLRLALRAGSVEVRLADGSHEVALFASCLSDGLGELTYAALALLGGADRPAVRWAEEPLETRWVLKREGARLRVRVLGFRRTFSNRPDEEGAEEFEARTTVASFAGQVKSAMQALLEEHGQEGYRALWRYAFPERAYADLAAVIRGRQRAHPP